MTDHANRAETLAERAGSHASQAEAALSRMRSGNYPDNGQIAASLAIAAATLSVAQRLADIGDVLETIANRLNDVENSLDAIDSTVGGRS